MSGRLTDQRDPTGLVGRVRRLAAAMQVSPAATWRARRDGDFERGDLRLCAAWRGGTAGDAGTVVMSVNEYRPHALADVPRVALAAMSLIENEIQPVDGAIGIISAVDPLRHITYSLSVWRSVEALREFTVTPAHLTVMREYRSRGYLRHIHWQGSYRSAGAAMAEATRRLDQGEGRRVGDARDRWARADQARIAALGATPAAPIWHRPRPAEPDTTGNRS